MEMSLEFTLLCWRKSGPLVFQCVPVWSGSKTALCRRCAGVYAIVNSFCGSCILHWDLNMKVEMTGACGP